MGKVKIELRRTEIVNIEETEKEGCSFSFLAGCILGDELYCSSWLDKGFYKINLLTGTCTFLKIFEKEPENIYLYDDAIYYKGNIWLIPANNGKYLVKINLKTLETQYFSLPVNSRAILGKNGVRYKKFKCCYKDGESEFWLVPVGFDSFINVNMETNEFSVFTDWTEYIQFQDGIINFYDACFIGDDIWMCPRDSKLLVIFNTKSRRFVFLDWKYQDESERFYIIKNYNDWAVFIPLDKEADLLLINVKTLEERRISLGIKSNRNINLTHIVADVVGQYVLLIPFLASEVIAIDLESERVQADTSLYRYVESMPWKWMRYQTSYKYGSRIIYTSDFANVPLMIYDLEKNEISFLNKYIEPKQRSLFLGRYYKKDREGFAKWMKKYDSLYFPETEIPLNSYNLVINDLEDKTYSQNKGTEVGKRIFSEVK